MKNVRPHALVLPRLAFAFLCAASLAPAQTQFVERPNNNAAVAWVRFADGPQRWEGTPYRWLGDGELRITFEAKPQPGDALELLWGAKQDQRSATLVVNGQTVPLEGGGYSGFRWLRVPLPPTVKGDRCEVALARTRGTPAFLAEVRLTSAGGGSAKPDLTIVSHKAQWVAPQVGAAVTEAFPERRPFWDREPADAIFAGLDAPRGGLP